MAYEAPEIRTLGSVSDLTETYDYMNGSVIVSSSMENGGG
jgi:hypothetical protein